MIEKDQIEALNTQFIDATAAEILQYFVDTYDDKLVVASSLGLEDQVITDILLSDRRDNVPRIMVLDTGRLPQETYTLMSEMETKYQFKYEVYFPESKAVETMVREKGINLFYESIENRKSCCYVRKVEPLKRALSTAKAWVTGIRKAQSITRQDSQLIEWDETHHLIKVNPLINWTEAAVWTYIHEHHVPYNTLHDQGYPSIGCAPCTRAVKEGEDPRSGRWWWEEPEQKECGLHIKDGKLKRKRHNTGHDS